MALHCCNAPALQDGDGNYNVYRKNSLSPHVYCKYPKRRLADVSERKA